MKKWVWDGIEVVAEEIIEAINHVPVPLMLVYEDLIPPLLPNRHQYIQLQNTLNNANFHHFYNAKSNY